MHKHELIFGKQQQFQQQKNWLQTNSLRSMNASCLFSKNFIIDLRIIKLHRKMILQ